MLRRAPRPRRGALAAEAAIVYPVMIFLLLLLIVGGMGVFRYQQVACLAREAARWASVRGADYQKDTGKAAPTQDQIRQQAALPLAAGMDPQQLTVQVQWVNGVTGQAVDWDASSKAPTTQASDGSLVSNTVRVTVNYQWSATLAPVGPLNLRSVSEMPISY
jgi:Flp pilus assembly protein TadG